MKYLNKIAFLGKRKLQDYKSEERLEIIKDYGPWDWNGVVEKYPDVFFSAQGNRLSRVDGEAIIWGSIRKDQRNGVDAVRFILSSLSTLARESNPYIYDSRHKAVIFDRENILKEHPYFGNFLEKAIDESVEKHIQNYSFYDINTGEKI